MSPRSKKDNKPKNNDNPESVSSGRTNVIIAIIGLIGTLGAAYFGYLGIRAQNEKPTPIPSATSITNTSTLVVVEPKETEQVNPYSLLAEASTWPLTESETFDDVAPGWSGFGEYSDEQVQHNMRIEDGRLLWGITPLVGNKWYWQTIPYHSYADFYLSFKIKRDLDAVNSTQWGVIFRKQKDGEYQFQLDDLQYFSVYLYDYSDWFPMIDWTKSDVIKPGEFNELGVIAIGPTMNFFINRQYVGSATESTVASGDIAFMVELDDPGSEITFEFDDFELRVKP